MKKILAALLVASFGAGLMASDLVYDYKASIKRLEPTISKNSKTKNYVSNYKVVSDTISGLIILPKCKDCGGSLEKSLDAAQNFGTAYLVRKGDKLSKKANFTQGHILGQGDNPYIFVDDGLLVPYVLVTPVYANSAIFGAYMNVKNGRIEKGKAEKAWMWLDYALPKDNVTVSSKHWIAKTNEGFTYGFLGLTQDSVKMTERELVQHTGFGTAKSDKEPDGDGICADGAQGASCNYVKTISGTLVGYPTYIGFCGNVAIWDVCTGAQAKSGNGVISGSWTLKYNNSKTNAIRNFSADEVEAQAFKWLKIERKYKLAGNYDPTAFSTDSEVKIAYPKASSVAVQ